MRSLLVLIGCIGVGVADDSSRMENWHHWRGPLANGVAPKAEPPTTWDSKTNIKWKAAIPGKSSVTPIVWGNRVFTITSFRGDRKAKPEELPKVDPKFERKTSPPTDFSEFHVYCFDRHSGKLLWTHKATEQVPHEGHHETHSYAAGSPTTDGERLYVSFGSFGIFCYDLSGKLLWTRDFGRIITRLGWGEAVTPVVHGDSLLLNWDQETNSKLICLDPKSGKTKWEAPRDEKTSWNTPYVVEHKGTTQVILNGTTRIRAYDLSDGKQIWECPGMTVNAIPSPVVQDGVAYVVSGYRGAAGVAIPLDSKGSAAPTWKIGKGTPYVPSPLLSNGRIYFTQANANVLTVMHAQSGKVLVDQERLPSARSFYGSPVAAAGRVYLTSQDGTTIVFEEADSFKLIATNQLGDRVDGSPAIAGKQLFLRSHGALYCIEK